jgi:DNA-binding NarL/FixJ family response regulator
LPFCFIEVVAEAESGEQSIQLYQSCQPDIVVLDLSIKYQIRGLKMFV